jgi:hypothetical protein
MTATSKKLSKMNAGTMRSSTVRADTDAHGHTPPTPSPAWQLEVRRRLWEEVATVARRPPCESW